MECWGLNLLFSLLLVELFFSCETISLPHVSLTPLKGISRFILKISYEIGLKPWCHHFYSGDLLPQPHKRIFSLFKFKFISIPSVSTGEQVESGVFLQIVRILLFIISVAQELCLYPLPPSPLGLLL